MPRSSSIRPGSRRCAVPIPVLDAKDCAVAGTGGGACSTAAREEALVAPPGRGPRSPRSRTAVTSSSASCSRTSTRIARAARRCPPRRSLRSRRRSTPPTQASRPLARAERVPTRSSTPFDPRFNPPIFKAAFDAGCTYLDMAMTLSNAATRREARRCPVRPGGSVAKRPGRLALVGIGVEPGLSDVFARYARDELFSRDRHDRDPRRSGISRSTATSSHPPSRSGRRSRSAFTRR